MKLPFGFNFNQHNLQDYVDCKHRFLLRYLQQVAWPAIEMEPAKEYERYTRLGMEFHHFVHQYILGFRAPQLELFIQDMELKRWWENFIQYSQIQFHADNQFLPEYSLSVPLGEFRLSAKLDLIIIRPDMRVVIYDWKTSRNRMKRTMLLDRLQTRIYPFILVNAVVLNTQRDNLSPDLVEMVYWFSNYPEQPEEFHYGDGQYQKDQSYLHGLANEIINLSEDGFTRTNDIQRCRFCTYRSLCDRGVEAGDMKDSLEIGLPDIEDGTVLDFEGIPEIEY